MFFFFFLNRFNCYFQLSLHKYLCVLFSSALLLGGEKNLQKLKKKIQNSQSTICSSSPSPKKSIGSDLKNIPSLWLFLSITMFIPYRSFFFPSALLFLLIFFFEFVQTFCLLWYYTIICLSLFLSHTQKRDACIFTVAAASFCLVPPLFFALYLIFSCIRGSRRWRVRN